MRTNSRSSDLQKAGAAIAAAELAAQRAYLVKQEHVALDEAVSWRREYHRLRLVWQVGAALSVGESPDSGAGAESRAGLRRSQCISDALKDKQIKWLKHQRKLDKAHARRIALLLQSEIADLQVEVGAAHAECLALLAAPAAMTPGLKVARGAGDEQAPAGARAAGPGANGAGGAGGQELTNKLIDAEIDELTAVVAHSRDLASAAAADIGVSETRAAAAERDRNELWLQVWLGMDSGVGLDVGVWGCGWWRPQPQGDESGSSGDGNLRKAHGKKFDANAPSRWFRV